MPQFSSEEQVFLEARKVGNMAQIGEENHPHVTPLCYASTPDAIYIETNGGSWKVRNLERRPEIAFEVDEYVDDWDKLRGIRLQGTVEVLREGREYQAGKTLLFRKYPDQFSKMGWTDGVNVVLKIVPAKLTSWGL